MRSRVALLIVVVAILVAVLGCGEGHYAPPQHPYPLCEKGKSIPAVGPKDKAIPSFTDE